MYKKEFDTKLQNTTFDTVRKQSVLTALRGCSGNVHCIVKNFPNTYEGMSDLVCRYKDTRRGVALQILCVKQQMKYSKIDYNLHLIHSAHPSTQPGVKGGS